MKCGGYSLSKAYSNPWIFNPWIQTLEITQICYACCGGLFCEKNGTDLTKGLLSRWMLGCAPFSTNGASETSSNIIVEHSLYGIDIDSSQCLSGGKYGLPETQGWGADMSRVSGHKLVYCRLTSNYPTTQPLTWLLWQSLKKVQPTGAENMAPIFFAHSSVVTMATGNKYITNLIHTNKIIIIQLFKLGPFQKCKSDWTGELKGFWLKGVWINGIRVV
jgi:hypothetical protein